MKLKIERMFYIACRKKLRRVTEMGDVRVSSREKENEKRRNPHIKTESAARLTDSDR